MPEIKFDFENQQATFTPPEERSGVLNTLSDLQSGLTISIGRGSSSFDIVSNVDEQQKSSDFGSRSLDTFFDETDPTPLTVNFSAGVYRVSIAMGDYGQDTDVLSLKAYSQSNSQGNLLASRSEILATQADQFSYQVLTVESNTPIQSIQMIGGSPGYAHSIYYDNLIVDTTAPLFSGGIPTNSRSLGVLSSNSPQRIQDTVSTTGADDYYQFSLDRLSNFQLALTGLSGDANVQVLDSEGTIVSGAYNSGNTAEQITLNSLLAGIYYLRVYPFNANTNYTLDLSSTPADSAGTSLSTARDLGTLGYSSTYKGWVGTADPNDFYKFSLAEASDLQGLVNGLSANVDLRLIQDRNSDGIASSDEIVASSTTSSPVQDAISRSNLAAGTYFLQVYPAATSNSNYQLTLQATPPDTAGNTPATARNSALVELAPGLEIFTISEFVGDADPTDYYRFNLKGTSDLQLEASNFIRFGELSTDVDMQVLKLNSDGTTTGIATAQNSGNSEILQLKNLAAGDYLVKVDQSFGNTTYDLQLIAVQSSPEDNAGNTLSAARDVGVLSANPRSFTDWLNGSDSNDYYRFSINVISNLNLAVNGLSADANLELIQDINNNGIVDNGDILNRSVLTGISDESITRNNLAVGTYFVRVTLANGGNTAYNLSLSAPTSATSDWFDQNLRDSGLISTARRLATDEGNELTRNDMIALFRDAQDGGLVDATERADLVTIVENATRFNMQEYVRYLSTQVNQGISTNLTETALESLIGRHFLGTVTPQDNYTNSFSNRPRTDFEHKPVGGSLFGNSNRARLDDIVQVGLADCVFLAALGAVVHSRPDIASSMIIDNGDDTYTVRFYQGKQAEYVTVDRRLAVQNEKLIFAAAGEDGSSGIDVANQDRANPASKNILWAALIERAYAQWKEFKSDDKSGYDLIGNGDNARNPLNYITGLTAQDIAIDFKQIQSALRNSQPIVAFRVVPSKSGEGDTSFIVNNHAYTITNAYLTPQGEQVIDLYNPWGIKDSRQEQQVSGKNDGYITLSWTEFTNSMTGVTTTA